MWDDPLLFEEHTLKWDKSTLKCTQGESNISQTFSFLTNTVLVKIPVQIIINQTVLQK